MKEFWSGIDKILLIFIDPMRHNNMSDVVSLRSENKNYNSDYEKAVKANTNLIIISFEKYSLIEFILLSCKLRIKKFDFNVRRVFYVNDGLMSSIFDSENVHGYRCFAKIHLPKPRGLVNAVKSYIPVILRAEQRYIILERLNILDQPTESIINKFDEFNFLMFSNKSGKLIFTNTDTLRNKSGILLKTTIDSDYKHVMKKEFETLKDVSRRLGESGCIPKVQTIYERENAFFFTEDYISGRSLRDILYDLAEKNLSLQASEFIERLDGWHKNIRLISSIKPKKITLLYAPTINKFIELYGDNELVHPIIEKVNQNLNCIDLTHSGLTPMISHNDLWPANLIVTTDDIIAIDWERSTEDQSGIFDYYWMMISTAIVYLKDRKKLPDYSQSFRVFVNGTDDISTCVRNKLKKYLTSLGINDCLYDFFILLFLIEWSIQGYEHLKQQTSMDILAFNELLNYSYDHRFSIVNSQ